MHFALGEEINPLGTDKFRLHFVENEGMAYGMKIGGNFGKLLLSLFRVVACVFLGLWMRSLLRDPKVHFGFVCCLALIWAGAFGNIIDSAVYGLLFSESGFHAPAIFMPQGGGYAGFLHGKVVDMLYFPIWQGILPDWIPIWGGSYTEYFRPVCNLADFSISGGVFMIIIGQLWFFPTETEEVEIAPTAHQNPFNTITASPETTEPNDESVNQN